MLQADSQSPKAASKVLIYLFGSLGDTLVAIPALRLARRHFPAAEFILLQNIPAGGNIVRASEVIPGDLIDGYIEYESPPATANKTVKLNLFINLWKKLRGFNFDAAIYLIISERTARSVKRDRFFFRTVGIRRFYGFHSFTPAKLYPTDIAGRPLATEHEAERKIRRLEMDGLQSAPPDRQPPFMAFSAAETAKIGDWLAQNRRRKDARLISIAPGCKTVANQWSMENFARLGHLLLAEENTELLLIGGKAEKAKADELLADWGAGISATGEFSVRESAALLARCDFHIGLDTGTTHLAAAVGTPCFAIYGGRDNPGQWSPLGENHLIVKHQVECAGCRLHVCPVPGNPCVGEISVEAVWENLREFMAERDENVRLPSRTANV